MSWANITRTVSAALLLFLSACSDRIEVRYADWEEARVEGAVARGWIPAFVPHDARDLHDVHDLDSNAQTLRFMVPTGGVDSMVRPLSHATGALQRAALEQMAGGHTNQAEVFMVCETGRSGALALDRETGRAVYLTPVRGFEAACQDHPAP